MFVRRHVRLGAQLCKRLVSSNAQTYTYSLPAVAKTHAEFVKRHSVIVPIQVRWGDQDPFQHVNNVTYFRYLETARIAYMEAMKPYLSQSINYEEFIAGKGLSFIVQDLYFRFRLPVTYPDTLDTAATIQEMKDDRIVFLHELWSKEHNKVAGIGYATVVTYDFKKGSKVHIPQEFREAFNELEAKKTTTHH